MTIAFVIDDDSRGPLARSLLRRPTAPPAMPRRRGASTTAFFEHGCAGPSATSKACTQLADRLKK